MCSTESDEEEYRQIRVIHRRPAPRTSSPSPRRNRDSHSSHCSCSGSGSSSSSSSSGSSSSRSDIDDGGDCPSKNIRYVIRRPRSRPRCYYPLPRCYTRIPSLRPSYTTVTRTRTCTCEETIYPARWSRRVVECEPVKCREGTRRVYYRIGLGLFF